MSILTECSAHTPKLLRVAFVIAHMGYGGAQRALVNLVNRFCAHGRVAPSILVLEPTAPPAYQMHQDVQLYWLGLTGHSGSITAKALNAVKRAWGIRRALLSVQPDVVVAFQDVTNVLTLLASQGTGLPIVVSERVHPALHPLGTFFDALRRLSYPLARFVVVQGQDIARWFPQGLRSKIRVIPNPVPWPVQALEARGTGPRRKLLAVGRLQPQKGFDLLLDAFSKLAATYMEWDLVILGEGPQRSPLEKQAKKLGIAARVHMPGNVADVGQHYYSADAFALPSRFEGFPNALAEAMSHGLPVVAADCPGAVRDLVQDGKNGLLVPSDDAGALALQLGRLLGSAKERQRLGLAAREVTQRFDEDKIAVRWEQMFREILEGAP